MTRNNFPLLGNIDNRLVIYSIMSNRLLVTFWKKSAVNIWWLIYSEDILGPGQCVRGRRRKRLRSCQYVPRVIRGDFVLRGILFLWAQQRPCHMPKNTRRKARRYAGTARASAKALPVASATLICVGKRRPLALFGLPNEMRMSGWKKETGLRQKAGGGCDITRGIRYHQQR